MVSHLYRVSSPSWCLQDVPLLFLDSMVCDKTTDPVVMYPVLYLLAIIGVSGLMKINWLEIEKQNTRWGSDQSFEDLQRGPLKPWSEYWSLDMWGETMRLRSGENQKTVSQTVLRAPTHNTGNVLFVFLTVWVDLIEHQVESSKGH